MNIKLRKNLIVVLVSALLVFVSLFGISSYTAKADIGNVSVNMNKGASVRLSTKSGLRFSAVLDNYNPDAGLEYGVVIVPKDYLTTYNINGNYVPEFNALVDNGTINTYINGKALPVQIDGKWTIQHSIVNLKTGNYDRDFIGIAYAFDGSNYQYATANDNERSITYVASAALNDLCYNEDLALEKKALYTENKDLLETFVTTGIANVTDDFNPIIDGDVKVNAGFNSLLKIFGTGGVKLQWLWESSQTNVAMVSSDGLVDALSNGITTITAKCSGLYQKAVDVTVDGKQYVFGAYRGVQRGKLLWSDVNGTVIEDVEEGNRVALRRLQEYKDAGLTVYLPELTGAFGSYNGTNSWKESDAKRVFDLCEQVGLKVLITDSWLTEICNPSVYTEEDFQKYFYTNGVYDENKLVARILKDTPYVNHNAFYGINLYDEPDYKQLDRFCKVYNAIKKAYPDMYVHSCLLPGPRSYENWTLDKYFNDYIDNGFDDYLMYDRYPINESSIMSSYMSTLKWSAELCKEKGIDLQMAAQTYKSGTLRNLDESDLYWLNNMLVGFGVKKVMYYTYYGKDDEGTGNDEYSFINADDAQTEVYRSMKKIMSEMQLLAPMALEFDYNASAIYRGSEGTGKHTHYEGFNNDTLAKISNANVDNERALVTELKNKNGEFMYMVQNVADPNCTCAYNTKQTTTLTFSSDVKSFTVFKDGRYEKVKLDGNTYTVTLDAGHAVYILLTDDVIRFMDGKVNVDDLVNKGETNPWG